MHLQINCPDCDAPLTLTVLRQEDRPDDVVVAEVLFDRSRLTDELTDHVRTSPQAHPSFHEEGAMPGTKPNSGTPKDGRRKANPSKKPGPKIGSKNKRGKK